MDRDPTEIPDSKKVIRFSEVYQFEDPIPVGDVPSRMQRLLYTTMDELKNAETTDSL